MNTRSHFVQLRHFESSAQWPEIVSCCGELRDGDQLLDVVDTDENEWVRDWRDVLSALMPRVRVIAEEEAEDEELEVVSGRTHIGLHAQNTCVSLVVIYTHNTQTDTHRDARKYALGAE